MERQLQTITISRGNNIPGRPPLRILHTLHSPEGKAWASRSSGCPEVADRPVSSISSEAASLIPVTRYSGVNTSRRENVPAPLEATGGRANSSPSALHHARSGNSARYMTGPLSPLLALTNELQTFARLRYRAIGPVRLQIEGAFQCANFGNLPRLLSFIPLHPALHFEVKIRLQVDERRLPRAANRCKQCPRTPQPIIATCAP